MIPQPYPLFAIDARTTEVSVVVGWVETTDYERLPVLAPAERPGAARMVRVDDARGLVYSTSPRPISPLPPRPVSPAPRDPDATVTMPAVKSTRLRP